MNAKANDRFRPFAFFVAAFYNASRPRQILKRVDHERAR